MGTKGPRCTLRSFPIKPLVLLACLQLSHFLLVPCSPLSHGKAYRGSRFCWSWSPRDFFFGFDFCALLIIPVTLTLEYSPGMLHHFATTTFVQFKLIFKKGHQWPCCFQLQSDLQHKLAEMESMHLFCLFIDVVDVRSLIWIRIYADTDQVTQLLEENQSFKLQSLTTMLFWEKWTLLCLVSR